MNIVSAMKTYYRNEGHLFDLLRRCKLVSSKQTVGSWYSSYVELSKDRAIKYGLNEQPNPEEIQKEIWVFILESAEDLGLIAIDSKTQEIQTPDNKLNYPVYGSLYTNDNPNSITNLMLYCESGRTRYALGYFISTVSDNIKDLLLLKPYEFKEQTFVSKYKDKTTKKEIAEIHHILLEYYGIVWQGSLDRPKNRSGVWGEYTEGGTLVYVCQFDKNQQHTLKLYPQKKDNEYQVLYINNKDELAYSNIFQASDLKDAKTKAIDFVSDYLLSLTKQYSELVKYYRSLNGALREFRKQIPSDIQ